MKLAKNERNKHDNFVCFFSEKKKKIRSRICLLILDTNTETIERYIMKPSKFKYNSINKNNLRKIIKGIN